MRANVIIGLLIHSTLAHVAGISCLCVDTNGLYALSGCHDGSVRMWEIDRRVCLQVCCCCYCFNKYVFYFRKFLHIVKRMMKACRRQHFIQVADSLDAVALIHWRKYLHRIILILLFHLHCRDFLSFMRVLSFASCCFCVAYSVTIIYSLAKPCPQFFVAYNFYYCAPPLSLCVLSHNFVYFIIVLYVSVCISNLYIRYIVGWLHT
jgi:hypothetical protein